MDAVFLRNLATSGAAWIDTPATSLLAVAPRETLAAHHLGEVMETLRTAEQAAQAGHTVIGYIAYEAGPAFEPACQIQACPQIPYAWFNVYSQAVSRPRRELADLFSGQSPELNFSSRSVEELQFREALQQIHAYIYDGDVYQVNYTFRESYRLDGSPYDLFRTLRLSHPVPYSAYMNAGPFQLVSLSPELFLRRQGNLLETKPMKGTAARRPGWADDEATRCALGQDEKNRAENVMIVDLMRNDLGRVCRTGSIRVPRLFEVARYDTVHQMTSTVTGELENGVNLLDILRATFPPGSVTGAPKIRATQIIAELETTPREIYTGIIGMIMPGGREFSFSVAIRTLLCDSNNQAQLGIGSGIVADSQPGLEWSECLAKRQFLNTRRIDFSLLETIRWEKGGGFLWLINHLRRLRNSAQYFGIDFDLAAIMQTLRQKLKNQTPGVYRVRLLLSRTGKVEVKAMSLAESWPVTGVSVFLCPAPVDKESRWLWHKTTQRKIYDDALKQAQARDCQEALLVNKEGCLTEGSYTSVFLFKANTWRYPADECGLLPGIWRARTRCFLNAQSAQLTPIDLQQADLVLIGNSLRGGTWVRRMVMPDGGVFKWEAPSFQDLGQRAPRGIVSPF